MITVSGDTGILSLSPRRIANTIKSLSLIHILGEPIILDKNTKLDQAYLDHYNEVFEQKVKELFAENKAIITKEGKKMRKVPRKHR